VFKKNTYVYWELSNINKKRIHSIELKYLIFDFYKLQYIEIRKSINIKYTNMKCSDCHLLVDESVFCSSFGLCDSCIKSKKEPSESDVCRKEMFSFIQELKITKNEEIKKQDREFVQKEIEKRVRKENKEIEINRAELYLFNQTLDRSGVREELEERLNNLLESIYIKTNQEKKSEEQNLIKTSKSIRDKTEQRKIGRKQNKTLIKSVKLTDAKQQKKWMEKQEKK
jgi:hypothetical protein